MEQNSRWKNGQFRKENEKHTSVTGMIVKNNKWTNNCLWICSYNENKPEYTDWGCDDGGSSI